MKGLWYGIEYWTVVHYGGYDPTVVKRDWSIRDVFDCYYGILIKNLMET